MSQCSTRFKGTEDSVKHEDHTQHMQASTSRLGRGTTASWMRWREWFVREAERERGGGRWVLACRDKEVKCCG